MQTKKLASLLALSVVSINMIASIAMAQSDVPITGSQNIECDTLSNTFGARNLGPDDFQVGDDGSRPVSSSNDTAYVEETNSAYFDLDGDTNFVNATDEVQISSNTPASCSLPARFVQLEVAADAFVNGSSQGLLTYGSDNAVGGTGSASDYYAMLSVMTSGNMTCTSTCTLATGSVESQNTTKHGEENFFANAGPNDNTLAAGFEATSNLISRTGSLNTVVLYNASQGFEGTTSVPGLDFNLSMVGNPQFTGAFTSTVTYSLNG
ncbi:hypothetical protein IT411_02390 [Candidatus Peregrinibacteria bacterium]|nr:hypothetical protein [Candidatus Peregrinibacteria bacterium]